jgi:hypothetical protein
VQDDPLGEIQDGGVSGAEGHDDDVGGEVLNGIQRRGAARRFPDDGYVLILDHAPHRVQVIIRFADQ